VLLENKKCFSILMTGLVAVSALGVVYLSIGEDSTVALAGAGAATKGKLPPIDEKAPARYATATFALG